MGERPLTSTPPFGGVKFVGVSTNSVLAKITQTYSERSVMSNGRYWNTRRKRMLHIKNTLLSERISLYILYLIYLESSSRFNSRDNVFAHVFSNCVFRYFDIGDISSDVS